MITEDSAKILAFIYKKGKTNSKEIIKYSLWDLERIIKAIKYLKDSYLIEGQQRLDKHFYNIKCSSEGINTIELNKNKKNPEIINLYLQGLPSKTPN